MRSRKNKPESAKPKQAARQSEERFRLLVETSHDWIWEVDPEGVYTYASPRIRDLLGYEPGEVVGKTPFDLMPPDERERVADQFRALVGRRAPLVGLENTNLHKDGRRVVLETSGLPVFDDAGVFKGYRGADRDITERKRVEQALRDSEERYRQLFDAESDAIFLVDNASGAILAANAAAAMLYGYGVDELLGMKNTDLSAEPSETQRVTEETPIVKDNAVRIPLRYHRKKDGTVFPAEITGRFFTSRGREVHIAAIRDITERLQAQEALLKSEQMLRTIVDAGPDCIKLLDRESHIILMNPAGLAMVEADSLDQVRGQAVRPLVAPGYRDAFMALTEKVFAGGSGTLQFEITGVKGRRLWLETFAVPLRDGAGEITALLGVTRDVTERQRAERALLESEERFRDLAESLPLTVFEADLQGRFTYANRAAFEAFGYSRREFDGGLTLEQVIVPEDRERARQMVARPLQGDLAGLIEYRALRKDGSTFPVTVASSPILRSGKPAGLRGIVADLTERRALEEERLKAQKLASVGTLAGGIAHDFNNLLQGVFGYTSLIRLTLDRREKALEMLDRTELALHQAVNLTNQLLTFSKGGRPLKKVIALRPVVENAATLALSGSRVRHELQAAEGLRPVEADEGQIGQVVRNIVLNAEQAMPLGGTVEISLGNVQYADPSGGRGADLRRGVEIRITDHGTGIPPEHLARIFDPYFTTKEKGSGLGLATSYSIVKNHDGVIAVESALGSGTTFTVRLPASDAAPVAASEVRESTGSRTGRILVMDDDAVVCDVVRKLLLMLGHEVACAGHGAEALESYRAAREASRPFDAVILDLTIRAGLGGLETLRELRAIDPEVRAVASSGYSEEPGAAGFEGQGFRAFLKKPYTVKELVEVLDRVLAS